MFSLFRLLAFICVIGINLSFTVSQTQLIQLNEENWEDMLTGEWMVEFYAPWCPACRALEPLWNDFSTWSKDLDLSVGQVDVTTSPGLSGRFMVTALPTIFHVIEGEFRQYKGPREREAFISFVDEQKWKNVDIIPTWKSPSSILMTVTSYFFKLSQVLRTIHNKLMEDYGLPNWGSYLTFAIVTIVVGALLGLMMVCCLDLFFPPKALQRDVSISGDKVSDTEDSEDELAEEELVDDRTPENNAVRKRKMRKTD